MSFLDQIVANTAVRVAERRSRRPLVDVKARLGDAPPQRSLAAAIGSGFGVIAEHKRRSPSGGASAPQNVADAFAVYRETPWVKAISVLTDEDYFDGRLEDLAAARLATEKPILRKDFIVDEYQVYEARAFGADAILLMASVLWKDPARLQALFDLARSVELDVLVELGNTERPIEDLVSLIPKGARIWGINARNFAKKKDDVNASTDPGARHDLRTDVRHHQEFRRLVPEGRLAVAESGIHTAAELAAARVAGYHAALIGTAFLSGPRGVAEVTRDLAAGVTDA
jgi:indole-3-glycerol phosphate synthase